MANNYYWGHKERLRKEAREKYQNLSEEEKCKMQRKARERYQNFTEEEKGKKHQYYRERNKSLSEEQKQKLVEPGRNHHIIHKNNY